MPGNARFEKAALLLAAGTPAAAVARECRVNDRTVRRWLEDPAFVRRVDEVRAGIMSEAHGRLVAGLNAAADRLVLLTQSKNRQVALAASRHLIGLAARTRELVSLEQRVAVLERQESGPNGLTLKAHRSA